MAPSVDRYHGWTTGLHCTPQPTRVPVLLGSQGPQKPGEVGLRPPPCTLEEAQKSCQGSGSSGRGRKSLCMNYQPPLSGSGGGPLSGLCSAAGLAGGWPFSPQGLSSSLQVGLGFLDGDEVAMMAFKEDIPMCEPAPGLPDSLSAGAAGQVDATWGWEGGSR